jgi:two-component system cell cycle sensor histidine kinase PleC
MDQVTAEMIERGAGSDPAAQRRRRDARRLRDVRAQLGSEGVVAPVGADEVDLWVEYASARRRVTPLMAALAVATAGFAFTGESWPKIVGWMLAALTLLAVSHFFCVAFLSDPSSDRRVALWRRRFLAVDFAQGLCWSALVGLAFGGTASPFVLSATVVWAALVALSAIVAQRAISAALTPQIVALGLYAALDASPRAAMGCIAAALAQAIIVVAAHRLSGGVNEGLVFRRSKESLIGELEHAKANSDEARRRAEDASRAKSKFLATMSHELRTPLNAILGFSEVMKEELFGPHSVPAYRDYAADIHDSGKHLLKLINEILDLSRVEAGRYELSEEPLSLADVVEHCQTLVAMRAQAKNIAVSLSVAPDLKRIWADERAIRQIALNLLSNAVKFTPGGGAVAIKVGWTASGGQYLSVRDNGPGIPEEELSTVMSSFGRGSMALRQAEEGSGLGLPIVKGLVELHGGVFTLKSRLREGVEAIVVFPPERVLSPLSPLADDAPTSRRAAP